MFVKPLMRQSLASAGTVREHETLRSSLPVPKGLCWEGLYIDDHVVLQTFLHGNPQNRFLRDQEILDQATLSWKSANLEMDPKKEIRCQETFSAWGAVVRSKPGLVAVDICKRRLLADYTLSVVGQRHATKLVLQQLPGSYHFCWGAPSLCAGGFPSHL